jgi:excisionase family DNA binding protein
MPARKNPFQYKPQSRYLSISQAAEFLGVSAKTLRRWDQRGSFPSLRTAGGQRRYHQSDLIALKKWRQGKKPVPEPLTKTKYQEENVLPVGKRRLILQVVVFLVGLCLGYLVSRF